MWCGGVPLLSLPSSLSCGENPCQPSAPLAAPAFDCHEAAGEQPASGTFLICTSIAYATLFGDGCIDHFVQTFRVLTATGSMSVLLADSTRIAIFSLCVECKCSVSSDPISQQSMWWQRQPYITPASLCRQQAADT